MTAFPIWYSTFHGKLSATSPEPMRHYPSLRIIGAIVALIVTPMLPLGLGSYDDQPDLRNVRNRSDFRDR